jgi:predicted permease
MRSILQDIRYALRQLRKSPGFTFTAVAVLALGMGANIAVFTILNGIFLRPLPYAQADRIVTVKLETDQPYYEMTYANMLQLRDALGAKFQIGGELGDSMASVTGPGGRLQVERTDSDAGLLRVLGVQPIVGRIFRDEDSRPGATPVVVLGNDVWHRLFHADPAIVGKSLTIRGQTYMIVGVMPAGFSFRFGDPLQIWTPARIPDAARSAMDGDATMAAEVYARVPGGMTAAQLADALSRTQSVIAKEVSAENQVPTRVKVIGYQESLNQEARKPLLLLYGVVLGIWALACINVTSLMLARAVARTREHAVRSALGASRLRLLQQSLVESLLLSSIGAAAGLVLGQGAIKLLWAQIAHKLPLTSAIHVDWRVTAALAVFTLVTSAVVGLVPALRAASRNVQASLHGVTATASASQNRTREVLVVAQLALTLIFLVGAGLFLRTIHALRQVPLGFTQQNVLTGGVILNNGSRQLEENQSTPGQRTLSATPICRSSSGCAPSPACRWPRSARCCRCAGRCKSVFAQGWITKIKERREPARRAALLPRAWPMRSESLFGADGSLPRRTPKARRLRLWLTRPSPNSTHRTRIQSAGFTPWASRDHLQTRASSASSGIPGRARLSIQPSPRSTSALRRCRRGRRFTAWPRLSSRSPFAPPSPPISFARNSTRCCTRWRPTQPPPT